MGGGNGGVLKKKMPCGSSCRLGSGFMSHGAVLRHSGVLEMPCFAFYIEVAQPLSLLALSGTSGIHFVCGQL